MTLRLTCCVCRVLRRRQAPTLARLTPMRGRPSCVLVTIPGRNLHIVSLMKSTPIELTLFLVNCCVAMVVRRVCLSKPRVLTKNVWLVVANVMSWAAWANSLMLRRRLSNRTR